MKKLALSLLTIITVPPLFASVATVSTSLNYAITATLGMYCGATQETGPNLGTCSTVNLGTLNDTLLPAYFSGASAGYYEDDVTFTTNSLGGGVNISGTGNNNSGSNFQLAAQVGGTTYYIPYYITYQSCTQTDRTQARRIDPSTGTITIPAAESSLFPYSGSGNAPCFPTAGGTPGNGGGALYFYVNNGNEVTQPIPADATTTYQDTLTLTVNAT